jgi:RNA polymerase sigma-70 factor (ECF subfamily)
MNYAQAAEKLGMKEGAVKVAVHRMRNRYREILHEGILATVASPDEVDDEINYLLKVLSR